MARRDRELQAVTKIEGALSRLESTDSRRRVLRFVWDRLEDTIRAEEGSPNAPQEGLFNRTEPLPGSGGRAA